MKMLNGFFFLFEMAGGCQYITEWIAIIAKVNPNELYSPLHRHTADKS